MPFEKVADDRVDEQEGYDEPPYGDVILRRRKYSISSVMDSGRIGRTHAKPLVDIGYVEERDTVS